jgi:hypothetical protein
MTIIDDARDWQQAIVDRDAARQAVADAALQHGNDQKSIDELKVLLAWLRGKSRLAMSGRLPVDLKTITDLKRSSPNCNPPSPTQT